MLNKTLFTFVILLYIFLYVLINIVKPSIIFNDVLNKNRSFGVGYKNTTILPLWLVSIILAIFSYFTVLHIYNLQYNDLFIH